MNKKGLEIGLGSNDCAFIRLTILIKEKVGILAL